MDKNYYAILGLSTNATQNDVFAAYKRLSLRHHPQNMTPDRLPLDAVQNYRRFSEITEAFDVLSQKPLRDAYDCKGYRDFVSGGPEGGQGYQFLGSALDTFAKFFGTANFFTALVQDEAEYNEYLKRQSKIKIDEPQPIKVTKSLTLQQLMKGETFEITFEKEVLCADLLTTKRTQTVKSITVEPGYRCTRPMVFRGEGNQKACCNSCKFSSRPCCADHSSAR